MNRQREIINRLRWISMNHFANNQNYNMLAVSLQEIGENIDIPDDWIDDGSGEEITNWREIYDFNLNRIPLNSNYMPINDVRVPQSSSSRKRREHQVAL